MCLGAGTGQGCNPATGPGRRRRTRSGGHRTIACKSARKECFGTVRSFSVRPIIEDLELDLGISLETIAYAVKVDRRTVARWRAHKSVPRGKTRERLAELVELQHGLLRQVGTR